MMWTKILNILNFHHRFLITTHINPDADGIGAACALIELLLSKGKEVRFVCDGQIPKKFAFLDYHQLHESYREESDYVQTEVLIILDANRLERIGRLATLFLSPTVTTLCIDHHETIKQWTPWQVIDPKACSVGAMIYSLYKAEALTINLNAATGIYASVLCDTGRFSYPSTSCQAHHIAEECMRIGVDPDLMHTRLFQHISLAETKMFASALYGMETYLDNKIAVQQLRKEECQRIASSLNQLEHLDLEYIHDFNYLIEGVQCFVLLREVSDHLVRVSVRSKNMIDISQVVKRLGGGGHANAAGIYWKGSLDEIKRLIVTQLIDLINKSAQLEPAFETSTHSTVKLTSYT